MTTLTLPELMLRNIIGCDYLRRTAEEQHSNYPPHNIERTGENSYTLTLAVAGFAKDDIEATLHNNVLTISGSKYRNNPEEGKEPDERIFNHRGISFRDFERRFTLADHVQVENVTMENGLLSFFLKRYVPEAAKPKLLTIG